MTIARKDRNFIETEMRDVVLAGLLLRSERDLPEVYSTPAQIIGSVPIPLRRCHGRGQYLGKITEEDVPFLLSDSVKRGIVAQKGVSSKMSPIGTNETYNITGNHYEVQMSRLRNMVQEFRDYWASSQRTGDKTPPNDWQGLANKAQDALDKS